MWQQNPHTVAQSAISQAVGHHNFINCGIGFAGQRKERIAGLYQVTNPANAPSTQWTALGNWRRFFCCWNVDNCSGWQHIG